MTFTIETNVPYVAKKPAGAGRGRKPTASFPFADMAVGASFLIPVEAADDAEKAKKIVSWRRKLANAKKKFVADQGDGGYKFKTALVDGGIRVWRTA